MVTKRNKYLAATHTRNPFMWWFRNTEWEMKIPVNS